MAQQQKSFDQLSFGQRSEIVRSLLPFPALTVMVCLRRDIGFRLLKPSWLFGVTLIELVFAVLFEPASMVGKTNPLVVFALVSFALGMYQRFKRWRELERGVKQHSFYIGTSPFEFRWMPMFFRRNRRIARFVDPLFVMFVSPFAFCIYPAFGFWLFLAAAGLRVFEDEVHEREVNQNLDLVDGLISSEIKSQVIEKFERGPGARQQQPESGLPTGVGHDIYERIRRRKAKQTPPQQT